MKKQLRLIALVGLFLIPLAGWTQSYSIDWYKIAGGGSMSSNSQFSVSGTIGQSDAGNMSGGNFSVTGGYWSLISVVQTVGAPTLSVTQLGNTVKVSWPSPSTGFVLQQNSNLTTTNWPTSGFAISDDGTNKSISLPSPAGNLFFRLSHP
jgi:hypothetical protein